MTITSAKFVPEINELEWKLALFQVARTLPKESSFRKRDERATDPPITPERHRLVSADIRHLSSLIGQLVELRMAEESDEYGILQASEHAYEQACELLIDAAIAAAIQGREIPHGCAATDSEGGIRIEWMRPGGGVSLILPASPDREAYIYHEVGDIYATELATAEALALWLRNIP
jgi:hypothetical protein